MILVRSPSDQHSIHSRLMPRLTAANSLCPFFVKDNRMGSNQEGMKFAENMNARLRSRKILHIDDDPQFTRLMQVELRSAGFQADALNDERKWEETLLHGGYRVVLLDMEMPYISGGQLLRKIKQHDGAIQVIMLTGLVRMFVVLDSLRDGAEYCFF